MSSKPIVRRTYGRFPPRTTSSSSMVEIPSPLPPSSPLPLFLSSSPPSSSDLRTPEPSSPTSRAGKQRHPLFSPPSSPLFAQDDDDEVQIPLSPQPERSTPESSSSRKNVKSGIVSLPKKAVQSSLTGFFTPLPQKRKRPLQPSRTVHAVTASSSSSSSPLVTSQSKSQPAPSLRQMHLTHLPLLHTCPECHMSLMRGGEDEALHLAHHSRVVRGVPWDGLGKGKGRAVDGDVGWRVIRDNVSFGSSCKGKGGAKGRIVVADGSWGGGKLAELLSMVDVVLSAPELPPDIMAQCKVFLFITASPPPLPRAHATTISESTKRRRLTVPMISQSTGVVDKRERVVSIVVAQGIKWAMRVLDGGGCSLNEDDTGGRKHEATASVESGGLGSVTCDPTPLPTPLGIHRLYTIPSYRSHSLHTHLLDAACEHTVYGCTFSPKRGQVAFSQPTESGRKVMLRWGGGGAQGVRVFVDDESQL